MGSVRWQEAGRRSRTVATDNLGGVLAVVKRCYGIDRGGRSAGQRPDRLGAHAVTLSAAKQAAGAVDALPSAGLKVTVVGAKLGVKVAVRTTLLPPASVVVYWKLLVREVKSGMIMSAFPV
jgi:hypothetical protein